MARSVRQVARQKALEAQRRRRRERAEAERRYEALGVRVAVALMERDAAVSQMEQEAGRLLSELTASGMTMADAVDWCGAALTPTEGRRLVKLAEPERHSE